MSETEILGIPWWRCLNSRLLGSRYILQIGCYWLGLLNRHNTSCWQLFLCLIFQPYIRGSLHVSLRLSHEMFRSRWSTDLNVLSGSIYIYRRDESSIPLRHNGIRLQQCSLDCNNAHTPSKLSSTSTSSSCDVNFHFFSCAFAKLRKATISFVISVCPHGTIRLPLEGFWGLG
jgi:hypothetical protein